MTYSSSLTDNRRPLVLDTSVLINLYACAYGDRILAAIPNDIIVPHVVACELRQETSRNEGERDFLRGLVASGRAMIDEMTEEETTVFANLTSCSPSLGDGEAATIAIAAERHFVPVIDDGKGRSLAIHVQSGREPGWSLDLFRHASVTSTLGGTAAVDALYLALRDGRMRVPAETTEYIIGLLGSERAMDCTCLPDYQKILGQFRKQPAVVK